MVADLLPCKLGGGMEITLESNIERFSNLSLPVCNGRVQSKIKTLKYRHLSIGNYMCKKGAQQ